MKWKPFDKQETDDSGFMLLDSIFGMALYMILAASAGAAMVVGMLVLTDTTQGQVAAAQARPVVDDFVNNVRNADRIIPPADSNELNFDVTGVRSCERHKYELEEDGGTLQLRHIVKAVTKNANVPCVTLSNALNTSTNVVDRVELKGLSEASQFVYWNELGDRFATAPGDTFKTCKKSKVDVDEDGTSTAFSVDYSPVSTVSIELAPTESNTFGNTIVAFASPRPLAQGMGC